MGLSARRLLSLLYVCVLYTKSGVLFTRGTMLPPSPPAAANLCNEFSERVHFLLFFLYFAAACLEYWCSRGGGGGGGEGPSSFIKIYACRRCLMGKAASRSFSLDRISLFKFSCTSREDETFSDSKDSEGADVNDFGIKFPIWWAHSHVPELGRSGRWYFSREPQCDGTVCCKQTRRSKTILLKELP